MQIKQVLTTNIEDTKIGRAIIILGITLLTIFLITQQFSVAAKCKRKVDGIIKLLPSGLKANNTALEEVKKTQIEDCVNESKTR